MSKNQTSPDELVTEARKQMLDGKEPKTYKDWALIMNFLAFNLERESCLIGCKLIRTLYNMPLSDDQVRSIVDYQQARKNGVKHAR